MDKPLKPANEEYRLSVLRDLNILDTEAEERFDRITRLVCNILDVPIAAISLVDENRQWFKSIQGLEVSETPRDVSFCAHAIANEQPLHVDNTETDLRFNDNPLVTNSPNIKSYHGVPLSIDGAYIGALCGIDTKPHEISNDQKQVLLDLGHLLERELVTIDLEYTKNLETQLQTSQEFQNLILENIPDYLFVKNERSEIVKANHHFINLYPENKKDRIIGYTTVEDYPEDEAEAFLAQDKKALDEGFSETEETICFPDGKTRTLLTKKVRFEDTAGDTFLLGLARDITNLKEVENALKDANSELEEFSYRTSHDLKSPLISTLSMAELCQTSLKDGNTDVAVKGLDHIVTSINKLLLLVDDLLLLTQTKNQEEDISEFLLSDLINEALEKFSHMPDFERLSIHKELEVSKPITSKISRVRLIVENLLSNSIKYQNLDEAESYIKIRTFEEGPKIILEIEDNGLGIPEKYKEKLFGMFNRFHTKTSYGSGLGLYMVKKSANIINGSVEYKATDKGTLFRIAFTPDS